MTEAKDRDPETCAATPDDERATPNRSLSMHDGVEVWEDCCSCEAEPYWRDAFADEPEK